MTHEELVRRLHALLARVRELEADVVAILDHVDPEPVPADNPEPAAVPFDKGQSA